MKKLLGTTALVAALTVGCVSVPAAPTSEAPAGTNQPPAMSTPATTQDSAPPSPSAAPQQEGVAPFGTAYKWDDGLSLTVSQPEPYKPSRWAAGNSKFTKFVVFEIRVVNNTGGPWEPGLIYATVQSANQEGARVFDSGQLPPDPSTKLLDGREVTFKMAFGVADPEDLVMEIRPDFSHESVLFNG